MLASETYSGKQHEPLDQASATSLPKQLFAASKMVGIPKAKIPEAISLPKSEKRQSREAKSSESTSDSKKKIDQIFRLLPRASTENGGRFSDRSFLRPDRSYSKNYD